MAQEGAVGARLCRVGLPVPHEAYMKPTVSHLHVREADIYGHVFFNPVLDGGERTGSGSSRFIPREKPHGGRWTRDWVGPTEQLDDMENRKRRFLAENRTVTPPYSVAMPTELPRLSRSLHMCY
jgi:hypothetical protein